MARIAKTKLGRWLAKNGLTREKMVSNSWLKPFASRVSHSELWRFTRRSVPRGVALGLLVGIFLLIPGVQIIGVALLAYPVRANIPIGAAMTFLSMPATTPFILAASLYVGNAMLGLGADIGHFQEMIETGAGVREWLDWLLSDVALGLVAGLAIISIISAAVGYLLASWGWRWWIGRKWRRRHHAHG